MQRRPFLAIAGGSLAGLTGCLGEAPAGPPGSTPSPSPEPTGTDVPWSTPTATPRPNPTTLELGEPYEPSAGWSVTLSNARVQRIALRGGTHLDPVGVPGGQYVVADVAVEGDPNGPATEGALPDPTGFVATLDGAFTTLEHRGFWAGRVGRPADDEGTIAVPVRTAGADRAAIRWRDADEPVEWRLAAAHREAIAHAPAFRVREFAVPESVEPGTSFDASLTVANTGARAGTFLAELGATTISDTPELRFDIPVGEAVDHVETVDPHVPAGAEELRIVLDWGLGRLERRTAVA